MGYNLKCTDVFEIDSYPSFEARVAWSEWIARGVSGIGMDLPVAIERMHCHAITN